MWDKHSFLDYLDILENFKDAEDELFYLDTKTELRDFRKKRVWKCGFVKFKFPNLNELIKQRKIRKERS
ncbi:hypothetical protein [Campylobacter devanensis]|uniref:hypothetical protein n=1 Tax=Campylobacter devanensis TaxID=3161138 RepID=UPI000A33DBD9|nr:hypothetical protein [Campylobacter sp. P0087]